jgi:hypothetical protein
MEQKDILLIILAFLGWSWGIFQFFINRSNQKKDKLTDRRFEAYVSYMKKVDELMTNVRTDPNMIYGISTDFMRIALTGDEELINNALLEFNEKLLDFVKKATEPIMILKQELNPLLITCSKELGIKIEELIYLSTDFNNEMQKALSQISINNTDSIVRELNTLGHDKRWLRFENLNQEIISQMRKEIGSN